ncbi:MAG: hypothetical protein NZ602_09010 [Thermoguttaceae bacterium]|nr:hypothetical protein [Thermoguttaceae bacterium]MDW8037609.1 hypothetical protein [Thermoguttaceae bacterium]
MVRSLVADGLRMLAVVVGLVVCTELGGSEETDLVVMAEEAKQDKSGGEDRQTELAHRVRRLVRQLDASQAVQRAQAEEALLALGPDILGLLPEPEGQESAEVAVALRRIREQLERRLAESVLQPSVLSLPEGPLSYWEVFERIYQQTGNRLRLRSEVQEWSKRLRFFGPVDKKPFWPFLDHLLDQGGMSIYPYDPGEDLVVVARSEQEQPRSQKACYVGPLRIAPLRLMAQRDYRTRQGDQLVLVLEVTWEPRIRPVVLRLPHQTLQAVDDRGRAISAGRADAQSIVPVKVGQKAAELEVRLALPDRSAKRLESIQGKLTATLPGAMQRFSFLSVRTARNQTQRRAGATVSLLDIRKEGPGWQIEVLLRYDRPSEAFQSHYHWFYRNQAYLESQDGQKIMSSGVEPFRHTDSEIGLRYQFEGGEELEKYTFVYEAPGLLLTEEFPFQLQQLPLP